jgi:tetrahydromethanopterin S-methyltransferase subunit G
LEESSKKVDNLQASTTPECEKINERLQEIKEKIDNKLNHYATVTIDVDRVISVLTNNKIKINQTVQRISSTRATINKKYEDIVSNVNEILKIFKQKTIESGPLFRGLPLDFLGSIIKSLKGHNALLILNKTDEVVNNLNQILADADSIANTVGISTNVFNDLRSQLMKGARPLTESIFVKDSFELYGIKLEIANLENEINQGCPNKRRTAYLNNNLKNYAYNNSKNYNLVSKSKININEAKVNNQNFILTLMANIFSKIVNLR